MTRPGIEPRSPGPLANTLTAGPIIDKYLDLTRELKEICWTWEWLGYQLFEGFQNAWKSDWKKLEKESGPSRLRHCWERLEFWEDFSRLEKICCNSNSTEKVWSEKLTRSKIIMMKNSKRHYQNSRSYNFCMDMFPFINIHASFKIPHPLPTPYTPPHTQVVLQLCDFVYRSQRPNSIGIALFVFCIFNFFILIFFFFCMVTNYL